MAESEDVRQMRKLKFLNKTSSKANSNLFGTEEKEVKMEGRRLFESSEIKEPSQTNYEIKTVRFNATEAKIKNQSNEVDPLLTENKFNNHNNESKNINYKEIFDKQIYYDKLLGKINNSRALVFIIIGIIHYLNTSSNSFKIYLISNIQLLFSIIIICETILGLMIWKLKEDKKKNILNKITEHQIDEEEDKKNSFLLKISRILSFFVYNP